MGATNSQLSEPLPTAETAVAARPSLELAMLRARLRLVRTPDDKPWPMWGITAPFENFELLGAGAAAQVRIAGECFYLMLWSLLFGVPLLAWAARSDYELEAGTAAGWSQLKWGQVLLDVALSTSFMAFVMYNQYRLMSTASRASSKGEAMMRNSITNAFKSVDASVEKTDGFNREDGCCGDCVRAFCPSDTVRDKYADEPAKFENVGRRLKHAHLVEACSVVLSGWGRGVPLPAAALDELAKAAGAKPVLAVQASFCLERELEAENLLELSTHLAEAQGRQALGGAVALPGEKMAALEAEHEASAQRLASLSVDAASTQKGGAAATAEREKASLIDHAFVTFGSSAERERVLAQAAAVEATLAARGVAGCTLVAAPHPGDVAWRNLEATEAERRHANRFFMGFMYPSALLLGVTFGFFCVLSPLLGASPTQLYPLDTYWLRFGYFAAITTVYAICLQSLIQPLFMGFIGKGFFGRSSLRITSNTYTAMHAKVGMFWLLVELIILSAIFGFYCLLTIGDEDDNNGSFLGKEFAHDLCIWLGLPNSDINFYSLWGTECLMNILMGAVAECLVASWLLPALPQFLVAPFMKTQPAADEWMRLRNPAILPFTISDTMRILAVTFWWSGIFPVQLPVAVAYYAIATFVARSNLLGRVEPGPPTKPLQYRLAFGVYLPLHLMLRFLFTTWIYMDVPLPVPWELPFGNLSLSDWDDSAPEAFHFLFACLGYFVLIVGMPLYMRKHAIEKGVHTPWELAKMWAAPLTCDLIMEDLTFSVSAKACQGTQSLALADTVSTDGSSVVLPPAGELHPGAMYRVPNGLDLLR